MLIMAMVAGALLAMSNAVDLANEYGQGYGTATQHARVSLERIDRTVNEAFGKGIYPGVWVTEDVDGQWTYPNTLIVWHPGGTPANAAGPPLVQELVVFCPDPNAQKDFVQLTFPGNTTPVPSDTPSLTTLIDSLKTSSGVNKVVLTPLLYVPAAASATAGTSVPRAAVRFVVTLTPSASAWAAYNAGTLAWGSLPWVLGIESSNTGAGLRQVWLRTEMQLTPAVTWVASNPAGEGNMPFFGSACFYYGLP